MPCSRAWLRSIASPLRHRASLRGRPAARTALDAKREARGLFFDQHTRMLAACGTCFEALEHPLSPERPSIPPERERARKSSGSALGSQAAGRRRCEPRKQRSDGWHGRAVRSREGARRPGEKRRRPHRRDEKAEIVGRRNGPKSAVMRWRPHPQDCR